MRYAYPVTLAPEDEGGFFVSFPDVPEALTGGEDRAEALDNARDALVTALEVYIERRQDLPAPSACGADQELLPLPPLLAAKLALYAELRRQGLTKVALGRRLDITEAAVRKFLDLRHRSHIGQVETALRELGWELLLEDRSAGRAA